MSEEKIWDLFIENRPKLPICLNFTVNLTAFCEFLQIIILILLLLLLWEQMKVEKYFTKAW